MQVLQPGEIPIVNRSGETIPGGSLARVPGRDLAETDHWELLKPNAADQRNICVVPEDLPDDAKGVGLLLDHPRIVKHSVGASLSAGDWLGTESGSWQAGAGNTLLVWCCNSTEATVYLAAEADTLDMVCDRGSETDQIIVAEGFRLNGVTGDFPDDYVFDTVAGANGDDLVLERNPDGVPPARRIIYTFNDEHDRHEFRNEVSISGGLLLVGSMILTEGDMDIEGSATAGSYRVGDVWGCDFDGVPSRITVVKGIVTAVE